jgi:hypothetical protein
MHEHFTGSQAEDRVRRNPTVGAPNPEICPRKQTFDVIEAKPRQQTSRQHTGRVSKQSLTLWCLLMREPLEELSVMFDHACRPTLVGVQQMCNSVMLGVLSRQQQPGNGQRPGRFPESARHFHVDDQNQDKQHPQQVRSWPTIVTLWLLQEVLRALRREPTPAAHKSSGKLASWYCTPKVP